MKNNTRDFAVHIVSACLPQAPQRRRAPSVLKAMRPTRPKSSASVNSGKKIAMGGSMTAMTEKVVCKTPPMSGAVSHFGIGSAYSAVSALQNSASSHADGAAEPTMVSQKMQNNMASMTGTDHTGWVSTASIFRSRAL